MSYNKTKTDPVLGQQVHEHLVKMGVETPVIDNGLSRTDKIDKIENNFNQIMETLGLDLTDDSLMDTPKRVAKMYVNEIFWGLDYEAFPKATVVDNKMNYNEAGHPARGDPGALRHLREERRRPRAAVHAHDPGGAHDEDRGGVQRVHLPRLRDGRHGRSNQRREPRAGARERSQKGPFSHWSPYDRVRVLNADP